VNELVCASGLLCSFFFSIIYFSGLRGIACCCYYLLLAALYVLECSLAGLHVFGTRLKD
jgi:hypothetical protein